jgi:tetrahydromethanopterin S-methyltransferase subunit F
MAGLLEYTKNGQVTEPPLYRFMRGNVQSFLNSIPDPSKMTLEEQLAMGLNANPIMGLLGTVRDPRLAQAATSHFGITNNPRETGYILDDGTRLDLSGRNYSSGYMKQGDRYVPEPGQLDYLRNDRVVDHRELGDLVGAGSGNERLTTFMDQTGAVRYSPDTGISLLNTNKPSQKQIETVVEDFRAKKIPLIVDIDNTNEGYNMLSKEFQKPNTSDVMDWINKTYKGLLGN